MCNRLISNFPIHPWTKNKPAHCWIRPIIYLNHLNRNKEYVCLSYEYVMFLYANLGSCQQSNNTILW
jgi:hypothetical protein